MINKVAKLNYLLTKYVRSKKSFKEITIFKNVENLLSELSLY